jgi:hypothetical protein
MIRRYVHPNLDTGRAAMEKAHEVQGGHKNGHNAELNLVEQRQLKPLSPTTKEG